MRVRASVGVRATLARSEGRASLSHGLRALSGPCPRPAIGLLTDSVTEARHAQLKEIEIKKKSRKRREAGRDVRQADTQQEADRRVKTWGVEEKP